MKKNGVAIKVEINDEIFNKLVDAFRDLAEVLYHPVGTRKGSTYTLTINKDWLQDVIDKLQELQLMLEREEEEQV